MEILIPDNTNLLVMCSSKNRSYKLKEMLESFYSTKSDGTEIVIYVSKDDKELNNYLPILEKEKHIVGEPKTMVQVLNYFSCELFPNIKYYAEVNDDHIYRTPKWDEKFISSAESNGGWGWFSGYTQHLPTAIFVTGNIIRALGYFFPPCFVHTHIDDLLLDYREINLLFSLPSIIIDHMHASFGKAGIDENFRWVYSHQQMRYGEEALQYWRTHQKESDFKKIVEAKNNAQA